MPRADFHTFAVFDDHYHALRSLSSHLPSQLTAEGEKTTDNVDKRVRQESALRGTSGDEEKMSGSSSGTLDALPRIGLASVACSAAVVEFTVPQIVKLSQTSGQPLPLAPFPTRLYDTQSLNPGRAAEPRQVCDSRPCVVPWAGSSWGARSARRSA